MWGFLGEGASPIDLAYAHDAEHARKHGHTILPMQDYVDSWYPSSY
jgi:hypothetical protein